MALLFSLSLYDGWYSFESTQKNLLTLDRILTSHSPTGFCLMVTFAITSVFLLKWIVFFLSMRIVIWCLSVEWQGEYYLKTTGNHHMRNVWKIIGYPFYLYYICNKEFRGICLGEILVFLLINQQWRWITTYTM